MKEPTSLLVPAMIFINKFVTLSTIRRSYVECSKQSLPRNFIIPLKFAHVTVEVLLSQASIKSVTTRLEHALASLLVMSDMELVVVFVLVCRALGLNTR